MNLLLRELGQYLDHLQVERGLSANTLAAYRRDLTRYVEFLAERGVEALAGVTTVEVTEFTVALAAGDGTHVPLAPSSVARLTVAVRGWHKFAHAEGQTPTDPALVASPVTQGARLPKALSIADVQALLEAPDCETVVGLRDRCLLELLYGTGARISEICALTVDDVVAALSHPDAGLRVIGKGNKERIVPLGSYARDAINAYLVRGRPELAARGPGSHLLLLNTRGRQLSRQSAWEVVSKRAGQAGISAEVSPHSLRHSFATHLLDGGADVRVVQELLGHASVATTQIYTLVTADHLREVYAATHPRGR